MKNRKLLALAMVAAMSVSLIACGEKTAAPAATDAAQTDAPAADAVVASEPSIDFEDDSISFVGIDKSVNSASDDFVFEVADFNGSKALKVTPQGKAPYVGIQLDALLGDAVSDCKTIQLSIGTENEAGFFSASGKIYAFTGEDLTREDAAWSVYLEDQNPKVATMTVNGDFVAGSYIVVSMETDVAKDKGNGPSTLYIDNIAFLDAEGNTLTADTSAEYVAVSTGRDSSNLFGITDAVEFEGFSTSAGGWAQEGYEMPQEIIDALVPGSVVEIAYSSSTGNMWLVMPDSAAGWMRVGVGDTDGSGQQYAYVNASKNIAQITYEQLAAVLGDDVSTWGARMQCESDGDWEVYSIKVGKAAPNYSAADAIEFADFTAKGDAWAQDGKDMPEDVINALVPGSIVEITYASESGDMWIVMPDSAAGWMRVGVGNADGSGSADAISDGSKAYITYEMIAEVCGDDVSTWGARMQCESDSAWEVYGIKVGTAKEFVPTNSQLDLGISTASGAWAQDGGDLSEEAIAALVPGSVINITYSSADGKMWIVMPDAAAGWMRVGVGNADGSGVEPAAVNGKSAQITYEMIADICGDDTSTWGTRIQGESDTDWEIYSITIGTVK